MTIMMWVLAHPGELALIGAIVVAADYGIGHAMRRVAEERLRRRARGKLALTYDDGPYSKSIIERLLRVLGDQNAKATFFLLGWRADEQPKQCELILNSGHAIGSHTQKHTSAWKNPVYFAADMLRGARTIAKYSGGRRWFRPPFGKMNLTGWSIAWASSLRPVFWTIDARDVYFQTESQYKPIEDVLQEVRRSGGAVVLLHDHHCEKKPENSQRTLELTRQLLNLAKQEQLEVVTVEALYK